MAATGRTVGRFDRRVLEPDPERRVFTLAVERRSMPLIPVRRSPGPLEEFDRRGARSATVVAFGKAAPAMASAVASTLADLTLTGLVVSNHSASVPAGFSLRASAHPVPNEESVQAGVEALSLVERAEELVVVLVSGGGSGLLEPPAPGLDLSDLVETYRLLVERRPRSSINAVRKHLSAVKGGAWPKQLKGDGC